MTPKIPLYRRLLACSVLLLYWISMFAAIQIASLIVFVFGGIGLSVFYIFCGWFMSPLQRSTVHQWFFDLLLILTEPIFYVHGLYIRCLQTGRFS